MSRYRPPSPPVSAYITPEGEQALREELRRLWKDERPRVTRAVSAAAAMGDRSENADYIYGKRRLREIDSRVRHLRKRLEILKVVNTLPSNPDRVYFGAWVEVVSSDDAHHRYRLVGPDEIDPARHHISIDSPMGKTLLGKGIGDEVSIQSPSGERRYEILSVHYPSSEPER
ncbi:MAG: transcription elongation factor GreB [Pseudomonadales bacterium]|nr:transcription elongation factor GreB [Pseudomonadales bacterium]